jgi:hypothetical protein
VRLKRFSSGLWCELPGADGVRLKIKPIGQAEGLRIASQAKTRSWLDGRLVERVDEWEALRLIFNSALEAWEGLEFEDAPGKEEQREALFRTDVIREFVLSRAAEIDLAYQAQFRSEEKNSTSSQSGSPRGRKRGSTAKSAGE